MVGSASCSPTAGVCLPSMEFTGFIRRQYEKTPPPAGRLFNTCRPVEGKFVDLLAQEPVFKHAKFFIVGLVKPVSALGQVRTDVVVSPARHKCMEWLDRQPPVSVVYVSFETTSSLPEQQITELAHGLKRSQQRFIWVLWEADHADIFAGDDDGRQKLPDGYEQRVAGVGLVVWGWAPQLDILGHRAMALFMSLCRWNSCMEGLSNGVLIVTWPLHSDQPKNALLVMDVLLVGVTARLALPFCVSFFRQVLLLLDLDEDWFKGLDVEGFLEVGYLCEAKSLDLFSCRDELGASDGYNGFSPLLTKAGRTNREEVLLATFQFSKDARAWWKATSAHLPNVVEHEWVGFLVIFWGKYFSERVKEKKAAEFAALRQKGMSVAEYEAQFSRLAVYAPHLVGTERLKANRFMDGLRPMVIENLVPYNIGTYTEMVQRA
ncbi:hypothetical protein Taro_000175 [Colocasia esculenta]|uniref:Retrotransposon gag domain-containing protein n=1 Tax=Colocasia esculenta TaxID=4460 RepID=A0A843TFU7_COLES|nr:hypothetical protein [Colocasia esculenta]